jgi:hypothetical protein
VLTDTILTQAFIKHEAGCALVELFNVVLDVIWRQIFSRVGTSTLFQPDIELWTSRLPKLEYRDYCLVFEGASRLVHAFDRILQIQSPRPHRSRISGIGLELARNILRSPRCHC